MFALSSDGYLATAQSSRLPLEGMESSGLIRKVSESNDARFYLNVWTLTPLGRLNAEHLRITSLTVYPRSMSCAECGAAFMSRRSFKRKRPPAQPKRVFDPVKGGWKCRSCGTVIQGDHATRGDK